MKYQIIIDEEIKEMAAQAVAQGKILDLKNDIVFKSFFSKECKESAYCRQKMLSAVICRTVTETKVLTPEILPTRTDGKFPRLDIHCKLDDGNEVDVELQNSMYQDDQIKRSIYYAATLTHNALTSGEQYALLPHVYQIMFMDFTVVEDNRLHHSYVFKERENHEELSDIIQIYYIELPKITGIIKTPPKTLSELEFWSMLIMSKEQPKVRTFLSKLAQKEEMIMANALLSTMSRNPQEWENQYGYERFVHDCVSREKYAFSQGERQGIAQGIQQGIAQGIQQGITQGITQGERNARVEAARRFLQMGLSAEQIAQGVGLSVSEICKLQ